METSHEQAISALKILVAGVGMSLTEDDLDILKRNKEDADKYKNRLLEISKAIYYGFFNCAAKGKILIPESRIVDKFGHSLEDNYPEANKVFLKFAKTYWTLQILAFSLTNNEREWIPTYLLVNLEQTIGPLFFPFPGSKVVSPSIREKTQRDLLQKIGANIDIEEFIRGNPILIRDRSMKKGKIEISKDLYRFCRDCIYELAVSYNGILSRHIEHKACFEMVMDSVVVPSEERTAIFEDIIATADFRGIPYNKLSPLNQFMLTIPGYVFYCLKTELPQNKELFNEAVILMEHPSFPQYLQKTIGIPVSKEIKGALFMPSIRGFIMTLILGVLVFTIAYFLFGWSWWLSLLTVGGALILDRIRKKHIGRL